MTKPLFERPEVRRAVQIAVGAALAIAAGTLISGQRWYWALITAYIVGIGAHSRGEALIKGLQRLLGTLAGVLIGIGLATLLADRPEWAGGMALFCLFFAFYAFQAAYGTMIFFITLMLALLYGLLGQFKPELLLLRLEETAAGAVIGMLAVTLVLPIRQRATFLEKMDAFLDALAAVIRSSADDDRRPGGGLGRESRAAVESLQQATRELRQGVGGLKREWVSLVDRRYLLMLRAARRCGFLAREAAHRKELTRSGAEKLTEKIDQLRRRRFADPEPPDGKAPSPARNLLCDALADELARLGRRIETVG